MTVFKSLLTSALTLLLIQSPALAQSPVRDYRRAHEHEILKEFLDLLAIPNVASDRENIRRNAAAVVAMMQRRKLQPRLLEAADAAAPPAVYGEWKTPGATRTLIFYAHYDGQPTDPRQWSGSLPWEPVLRTAPLEAGGQLLPTPKANEIINVNETINPEWRLYGRSAADDKAGVMAILSALDALIVSGVKPTSNLKFFFDGEEEAGSPHLAEILRTNQELLQSDAWMICDGPVHQSGLKQVVFGVRGDTNVDLTVYGAKRPLHSGHYGNWSPNPALILAQLLASMKDASGRVTIAGWYDNVEPLGEAERRAIAEAPQYDDTLKSQLGLARTEGQGKSLLELINEPSLNINGMSSGDVGALARNVIPTTATAVLDLRLVKGNDYQRQFQRLVEHLRKQGFYITDHDPTDAERARYPLIARVTQRVGGYNAERTRMDLPISLAVIAAVQSTSEQKIVRLPTAGGSLPLSIITDNLKTVTMTVPIANYDNNQHAENENLRLQNLWDGIETMAAIMTMK
ncbi:MAG TPA: M20/M25/M40 family metallo-hydrolase [Pyrinomonadaceae bacterium]|jgi:acetylornithine deacetylase/succinyl-diaminopimelate desuccinylase-like protein|nr:M20/M25/M40 family metallo-hydrolase [Pyrinomonadaceae bacterium]